MESLQEQKAQIEATLPDVPFRNLSDKDKVQWLLKKVAIWLIDKRTSATMDSKPIASVLKDITGLSNGFIYNVLSSEPPISGPSKKRGRPLVFTDDDTDAIRQLVYRLHGQGQHPKAETLMDIFVQERYGPDFHCHIRTFRKFLKEAGLKYGRTRFGTPAIVDDPRIQQLRDTFLDRYFKAVNEGRLIYFTDETWIHVGDNQAGMSWYNHDPRSKNPRGNINQGPMLIIAHVGSKLGFVKRSDGSHASFVMLAGKPEPDYHKNMNAHNWELWMTTSIIPNMKSGSVLVLDNVAFHKRIPNRKPTYSATKQVMRDFLLRHGSFEEHELSTLTKIRLFNLIQELNVPQHFALHDILQEKNIDLLFLPPYHPHFNPIEFQWSQIKPIVKQKNLSQTEVQCRQELENAFSHCDRHWNNQVRHCESEMMKVMTASEVEIEIEMEESVDEEEVSEEEE